ncbi:MAG: hypothetical protein HZB16_13660 [Armatimonadetes bacterium]|nr:hypothetical protein [Armatimonadota bacterium]
MSRYYLVIALLPLMLLAACHRPAPPLSAPAASAAAAPPAAAMTAPSNLVSDPEVGEFPEPGWLLAKADELKLSAEQKTAVKKASDTFLADTKADREQLERQSAEFMAYLKEHGEKVDPAEVNRRNDSASEASARVMAKRKQAWEPLWKQMNPGQQSQVKELRARDPFGLR